jgi:hypothetical protein
VSSVFVDQIAPDPDHAWARIDQRLDRHDVFFDRGGSRDDLERGARLVQVLNGAIALIGLGKLRYALGLNVGSFAIARISPVRGFMTIALPPAARFSTTPCMQFALGDVLQVLVNRELERSLRRSGRPRGARKRLNARRRASV